MLSRLIIVLLMFLIIPITSTSADEYNDGYNDGEVVSAPSEVNDAEYMEGYEDGEFDEDRDESSDIGDDTDTGPGGYTPDYNPDNIK